MGRRPVASPFSLFRPRNVMVYPFFLFSTDVNICVDGMPVNMVSHAHGQGCADRHFIIPETIAAYEFGKGTYYAGKGDFATAGYVAYNTINVLDHNTVKLEGREFNHARVVAMINLLSQRALNKGQSAYLAGEGLYFDGPFHYGMHFNRGNLFGKFITPLGNANKLTVEASNTLTASGYFITDLTVNYTRKKFEVGLIIENLFGTKWKESQVEELSRLKNETQPVDQISYTPGIPFFARLKCAVFF